MGNFSCCMQFCGCASGTSLSHGNRVSICSRRLWGFFPSWVQPSQQSFKTGFNLPPLFPDLWLPSLGPFILWRHCKIFLNLFWKDLWACAMWNRGNKRNSFQVSVIVVNSVPSRSLKILYPHVISPSNQHWGYIILMERINLFHPTASFIHVWMYTEICSY